jgi:hypothetical protein
MCCDTMLQLRCVHLCCRCAFRAGSLEILHDIPNLTLLDMQLSQRLFTSWADPAFAKGRVPVADLKQRRPTLEVISGFNWHIYSIQAYLAYSCNGWQLQAENALPATAVHSRLMRKPPTAPFGRSAEIK